MTEEPTAIDPEVGRLAYQEAALARDQMAASVDELRSRTGSSLTILATTTAIFVAVATSNHESVLHHPVDVAALVLFVAAAFGFAYLLLPIFGWKFWADPEAITRLVAEGHRTVDQVSSARVSDICAALEADRRVLGRLQWIFILSILAFVTETTLWVIGII